jgi:hypothetical protein
MTAVLNRRSDVDELESAWAPAKKPRTSLGEAAERPGTTGPVRAQAQAPERLGIVLDQEQPASPLRASFAAISGLRASSSPADWPEAAAVLKRDAVRLRNTHLARHSSVLLALADALTFTDPADPALGGSAAVVFDRSLSLLSEPFIGEPAEEDFLSEMLSQGWNLAPASSLAPPEE